jgi:ribosomal subunit interface protein
MNKTINDNPRAKREHPPFDVSISNFGLTLTDDLRNAVTRKIGRARQYAPDALRALVDIEKIAAKRSVEQFRVLVRYEVPGYDVIAEHRAHEPLAAIDLVAEKIERRLRKRKTAFLAARFGRLGRPVRIADICLPFQSRESSPLPEPAL